MTESTILVLDDDRIYCSELRDFLQFHGCAVNVVHDVDGFEAALPSVNPDLVLVDKCLSNTTGTEVLRRLRSQSELPCIIITGRSDHMDRIVNLELGADDEFDKSLPPRELLARIRTVLRRSRPQKPKEVPDASAARPVVGADGTWRLSVPRRELVRPDGSICHLTASEFETLRILAEAGGAPVSRSELSERVFRRPLAASDRAVDTAVRKIREKIRLGSGPDPIKSVRNVGYVFVGFDEP
jgi:DNA-binding response OmpR family regulator